MISRLFSPCPGFVAREYSVAGAGSKDVRPQMRTWGLPAARMSFKIAPVARSIFPPSPREFPWRRPMPRETNKVIISCAITGSIHTPTMSDALPITPDQIAEQSIAASEAGAAILHLHARDPKDGRPSPD